MEHVQGGAGEALPVELTDAISAIDKALTVDFSALPAATLRRCLVAVTLLANKASALDAHVLEAADDPAVYGDGPTGGSATLRAWLCNYTNGRRGTLGGRAGRSHKLGRMPLVQQAFEAGLITNDHVRILGELTQPRFYDAFIASEAQLVQWATEMTWDDFAQTVTHWRNAADPTDPDLKDEQDQQARSVNLSRSWKDRGMLDGTLTPEARVLVGAELDRISRQLLHHDRAEAKARLGTDDITNADLRRTAAQRRHDALVIMARRSNGAPPDTDMTSPVVFIRASIQCVEAALAKAAGIQSDPVAAEDFECQFDDGTALTYSQLVRHLIRSKLHSVALSQEGEVLHFGAGRRWFSRGQKLAMAYRDRVCQCGCGLPASQVDADHDIAWLDGPMTDIENAAPRCRTTHSRKTAYENRSRRTRPPDTPRTRPPRAP